MVRCCEVYDDEQVQLAARREAARLAAGIGAAGLATSGVAGLVYADLVAAEPFLVVLTALWVTVLYATRAVVAGLRRTLWCVKLTPEEVAAFDCSRRKRGLAWGNVRRIELSERGVTLVGPPGQRVRVPGTFEGFVQLGHRLVEIGERLGVPVFVDGQPWQNLDVYAAFPELGAMAANRAS